MWSTPSIAPLPGPLRLRVVAPDRVLSMGQIELFEIELFLTFKQCINVELNCLL